MGSKERKARERDQLRHAILDTTRTLLLKKGIHNISIRNIAEASELGTGVIYGYFSSKEEIYAALSEEIFELIQHRVEKAIGSVTDPIEQIRRLAKVYLNMNLNDSSYYEFLDFFISTPIIIFPPDIKMRIDTHGGQLINTIENIIKEGINQGIFRPTEARSQAFVLLGTIHGIIHFKKLRDTILPPQSFMEIFNAGVDGFIKSLC